MKITFRGYASQGEAETLTNFPALVILQTNITGFSYVQFRSATGGDLRFQDSNETAVLSYEIESWDTNGSSFVWVKVPSISTSNDYIWAYWGSNDTNSPYYTTNGSTWLESYAGVWHLKESGFPYADSTAACRDGTSGTAPVQTNSGAIGLAQVFNGSTHKIDVPYSPAFNTNTYTVSCWANVLGGSGTYRSPVTCRDVPGLNLTAGYVLYVEPTNGWSLWQGNGAAWANVLGPSITSNTWAHVAGTYDGTNMRLFVNGVQYGPIAAPLALNTARPLRIGAGRTESAGDYWFNGMVDEVRVENVVRSTNWLYSCTMNQGSNDVFNIYGKIETRFRGTVISAR
jgi:hypothetical protein